MSNRLLNTEFTEGDIKRPPGWRHMPKYAGFGAAPTLTAGGSIELPPASTGAMSFYGPWDVAGSTALEPAIPGMEYTLTMTAHKPAGGAVRNIGIAYVNPSTSGTPTPLDGAADTLTSSPAEYVLTGTVPEDVPAGMFVVAGVWGSVDGSTTVAIAPGATLTAGAAGPTVVEVPDIVVALDGYQLPEAEGVTWTVNGEPAEPGMYLVDTSTGPVTVTIQAVPAEGYAFAQPAEPMSFQFDPPPAPAPEGWPSEPTDLGRLTARWLGWDSDEDILRASFYADVVAAFVWGYTRGRGFTEGMTPSAPLERVVVSGAARLAYNPESVTRYQSDNQSEVMAVFQGFHLAEQQILNRYRRRFA